MGGKTLNKTKDRRFYETYAWIIFLVIGVLILTGGIPHMCGNNTDAALVELTSGQIIEELRDTSPMFFRLYNFCFSGGGLSDVGVGFFVILISVFAYRTEQKSAWYSLWFVPLFFTGWLFLISPLPDQAQSSMRTPLMVFIVLSVLGLLLPFRKFIPKQSATSH